MREQDFDSFATRPGVLPLGNDVVNKGVDPATPPALWNYYGDNSCGFVQPDEPVIEWPAKFSKPLGETKVIAYTNTQGMRIGGGDPWIGLPVALNVEIDPAKNARMDEAKLVDVDPVCPWSSQIFVESFRLGKLSKLGDGTEAPASRGRPPGGLTRGGSSWTEHVERRHHCGLRVRNVANRPPRRAAQVRGIRCSRISRGRTPGGAGAVPRPGLDGPVRDLPHLVLPGRRFPTQQGYDWSDITSLYTEYASELARYERGELTRPPRPVNRAYSNVVGWIAPWTTRDMRSAPTGRILHASNPIQPVNGGKPQWIGPAALDIR